ncbi:hypothetical protein C8R47DRAFT_1164166 [Mycena vitilis]|nr:hypothetical protein C8R47DRAFT_1164166 [Mycena vitilis]
MPPNQAATRALLSLFPIFLIGCVRLILVRPRPRPRPQSSLSCQFSCALPLPFLASARLESPGHHGAPAECPPARTRPRASGRGTTLSDVPTSGSSVSRRPSGSRAASPSASTSYVCTPIATASGASRLRLRIIRGASQSEQGRSP